MRLPKRLLVAVLLGLVLGSYTSTLAQSGPFSAQIQRALNAFVTSPHTWTAAQTFSGGTVYTGPVVGPASGTCVTPAFTITGDLDSGLGWLGANNIGLCVGGTAVVDINTTRILSTIPLFLPNGSVGAPSGTYGSDTDTGSWRMGSGQIGWELDGTTRLKFDGPGLVMGSNTILGWGDIPGVLSATTPDLVLVRDAANTLNCRNGTNPCEVRVTRTYTDASNNAWTRLFYSGNDFVVRTTKNGSGTTGALYLQAGGSVYLGPGESSIYVAASADFSPSTNNSKDFGQSGLAWKTGYFGTSVVSPAFIASTSIAGPKIYPSASANTSVIRSTVDGNILFQNNAESGFSLLQFGGTTSSFGAIARNGAGFIARLADDSADTSWRASDLQATSAFLLGSGGRLTISATAPTIASGGCTAPAVTWSNGTATFLVTIGTSCTGVKTFTLTMPAATNGWAVDCKNNTSDAAQQTNYAEARATSTTAVVVTSYDRVTGLQEDFTASDTYLCKASGG